MTDLSSWGQENRAQQFLKGTAKTKKASVDKKAKRPPINVSEHGRYQIKSGLLAGKFFARAFRKPPTEGRGVIAEASGVTEEAAITALHETIDARETRRIEARRRDTRTEMSVPSIEEYAEALGHLALTRPQRAMLTALSLAEPDGLTEAQLAKAAQYKSLLSAKRSLASVGRLISSFLALEAESREQPDALEGVSLFAFRGEPRDEADPGNWILYPEMRDAVKATL